MMAVKTEARIVFVEEEGQTSDLFVLCGVDEFVELEIGKM